MPRAFTLKDARYALLTYAQVPESQTAGFPGKLTDLLCGLGAEFTAARERHTDGGIHFHVFVNFGKKFSSRNTSIFDCDGRHPNIERVGRSPRTAWEYVIKDGDIVAGDCNPPPASSRDREGGIQPEGEGEHTSDWGRIVLAETRDEFFDLIRRLQPRSLVVSFMSIARYADWRYRPVAELYKHPENWFFNLESYPILLDWVDESLRGGQDR